MYRLQIPPVKINLRWSLTCTSVKHLVEQQLGEGIVKQIYKQADDVTTNVYVIIFNDVAWTNAIEKLIFDLFEEKKVRLTNKLVLRPFYRDEHVGVEMARDLLFVK
jgi:hypothetical protein